MRQQPAGYLPQPALLSARCTPRQKLLTFFLCRMAARPQAQTGKMVVIVIQEFCDRGTLDNAIRKRIFEPSAMWSLRLARRTVLRTAGEMARGLAHMHEGGIIHGDLKVYI